MDYPILLELATDLGYELAMAGAETFRVEESISRVLGAYGIHCEVFAIPNYLVVSIQDQDGHPITRMRRIGHHGNNLDAVEKFNGVSRALCNRRPDPQEGLHWLEIARQQCLHYSIPTEYLGYFLGAFGFCFLFGGCFLDAVCAGFCGLVVGYVNRFLDARRANQFFRTIASAFIMAEIAYGMGAFGITDNPDSVIIGALMILVPGLLFTNAMRDIIYGDTNSGINRIVQVFLVAVAIVLGTASAWKGASMLWGTPVSSSGMQYGFLWQGLFALIGCIGFAILFNVHGNGSLLCALGGVLSWWVFLYVQQRTGSDITAYFWSSLFSSVYSEIIARIRKYPAISYLVISLFPMIPGAGVYYTMNYAVQGEMELFAQKGMFTAATAGIMAVGILLGSTVFRMYYEWKASRKH